MSDWQQTLNAAWAQAQAAGISMPLFIGDAVRVSSSVGTPTDRLVVIGPPDVNGFVQYQGYPGFRFLCNLTLASYNCTTQQAAMICQNVGCDYTGALEAAAFAGFSSTPGYSDLQPCAAIPPSNPRDPFAHWTRGDPLPPQVDGQPWLVSFRAGSEAEAAAYLINHPPHDPRTDTGHGGGFSPASPS